MSTRWTSLETANDIPITHNGAKKLSMNAKPLGHVYTDERSVRKQLDKKRTDARFSNPPNANDGGFLNSLGVAAGIPMIMARHRLSKHAYVSSPKRAHEETVVPTAR